MYLKPSVQLGAHVSVFAVALTWVMYGFLKSGMGKNAVFTPECPLLVNVILKILCMHFILFQIFHFQVIFNIMHSVILATLLRGIKPVDFFIRVIEF